MLLPAATQASTCTLCARGLNPMLLRACYAMSSTDLAYAAVGLRNVRVYAPTGSYGNTTGSAPPYGDSMCGTELAYAATRSLRGVWY
eukprot:3940567-Rhodomonas_salina.3